MRITIGLFVLAAATFGGPINLVQNGDFETGDLTGWTVNPNSDNDFWMIDTNPHGGRFNVNTGCQGDACIHGSSNIADILLQDLATIIGHTYTLSFEYDPDAVQRGGDISELLVQWGGTDIADLVLEGVGGILPEAIVQTPSAGYNQYTISGLTVTTTSTELNFLGRQDPRFARLDDIVVTDDAAVPEPASYLMAAGGLAVLGAAKLRARRA